MCIRDSLDIRWRHALEPDRLPDAAGARIPDRMRLELPVLLAARLTEVVGVVLGKYGHRLSSRVVQRSGDVRLERRVAPFVSRDVAAVDPHLCDIIDRTEVQEHTLAFCPDLEVALIPAGRVERRVRNAACRRLRRKRHANDERPLANLRRMKVAPLRIEAEAPISIETSPPRPPQERAWISVDRDVHVRWRFCGRGGKCRAKSTLY